MSIYKMTSDLVADVKGQSYMDAGIHENVELVEVVCETSKNGNPFLAFYFENEKGERASKTEWPVNSDKPMESMTPEEKEAYQTKVNNQMARIATIAKNFLPKDELLVEADSFGSFIKVIKNKLEGKTKGTKLRIKIIYDYNDWATLPSYLKYSWIEKMDEFPTEKSRIKIVDGIDKMSRSKADTRKTDANPFNSSVTDVTTTTDAGGDSTEDLPF
jgi:hypothetical protein